MKIHNFEQNSQEWYEARLGVITASNFAKILTPKKLEPSTQSEVLIFDLASEILTNESAEMFNGNYDTERGHTLEPDAAALYEMTKGIETVKVGFITNDEGTVGASPDRLIDKNKGLEIKCPAGSKHLRYLKGKDDLVAEYKYQIQGGMLVSERDEWDIMSYHPTLPPVIETVKRDEVYLSALAPELKIVAQKVKDLVAEIKGKMK